MKLRARYGLLLATIVVHCVLTTSQAQAQTAPPTIYGCLIKATGLLRYVNVPSHCSSLLETPLHWMRSNTAVSGAREPPSLFAGESLPLSGQSQQTTIHACVVKATGLLRYVIALVNASHCWKFPSSGM
jgi:hypothetical protein